jgi:hypothetical protein
VFVDARAVRLVVAGLALAVVANVVAITKARADVGSQWDTLATHGAAESHPGFHAQARGGGGAVIGSRPRGCPHRFCGCALSLKLFGRIVPDLNLAWNWARKFPRTQPRVGAVAVRRGHVMQIIGGRPGNWTIWDANSGGGKIRIHQRSVAGYVFVDPSARYAEAR